MPSIQASSRKAGKSQILQAHCSSWEIAKRQPRTSQYIFPYNPKSVGAAFTRGCAILGIKDIRFHDLRHEATSRLFERGYEIHEAAQFTLHESWNDLNRYAHLRPQQVRDLPASPNSHDAEIGSTRIVDNEDAHRSTLAAE